MPSKFFLTVNSVSLKATGPKTAIYIADNYNVKMTIRFINRLILERCCTKFTSVIEAKLATCPIHPTFSGKEKGRQEDKKEERERWMICHPNFFSWSPVTIVYLTLMGKWPEWHLACKKPVSWPLIRNRRRKSTPTQIHLESWDPDLQNISRFIVRLSRVYRKIDLTIMTYNVLRLLLGIS